MMMMMMMMMMIVIEIGVVEAEKEQHVRLPCRAVVSCNLRASSE